MPTERYRTLESVIQKIKCIAGEEGDYIRSIEREQSISFSLRTYRSIPEREVTEDSTDTS